MVFTPSLTVDFCPPGGRPKTSGVGTDLRAVRLCRRGAFSNEVRERLPNWTQARECQFLSFNPLARAHLICVALNRVLAERSGASKIENRSLTPFPGGRNRVRRKLFSCSLLAAVVLPRHKPHLGSQLHHAVPRHPSHHAESQRHGW